MMMMWWWGLMLSWLMNCGWGPLLPWLEGSRGRWVVVMQLLCLLGVRLRQGWVDCREGVAQHWCALAG